MPGKSFKWDGRSRITTKKYKDNYNEIFGRQGSVLNTGKSFKSKDYTNNKKERK